MRLRKITLGNVRRFQGREATLAGLGDGVTTICAPNESGKSTFFDALHALFFVDHKSQSAEIKSLQPHSGGAVRIAAEVEFDDGRFLVEKVYLSRKTARVTELETNRLVGMEGEAEDWIKSRIFQPAHGPAGLLWVRQGIAGFGPEGGGQKEKGERERLKEARRDLMSSVAGQIDAVTGGRRMDAIMERCREAFDKLATSQMRPKAGGPWAAQEKIVRELEAEQERLSAMVESLGQALRDKARLEADLAREQDPEEAVRRDKELLEARRKLSEARAHALKVEAVQRDLKLSDLEVESIETRLSTARASLAERRRAATRISELRVSMEEGEALLNERRSALEAARKGLTEKSGERKRLAADLRAARLHHRRAEAARSLKSEEGRLGRAEDLAAAAGRAQKALEADGPTAGRLEEMEALQREIAADQAQRRQAAACFEVDYYGGAQARDGAGEVIEAGVRHEVLDDLVIELPDVARIRLHPAAPSEGEAERLSRARADLEEHLAAFGLETLDEARRAVRARDEARQALASSTAALEALVPEGLAELRETTERLRREMEDTPEDAPSDPGRDIAEIEMELERVEAAEARCRSSVEDCVKALQECERTQGDLATENRLAAEALDRMDTEADLEARIASDEPALREKCELRESRARQLADLEEAAPSVDLLEANVERIEGAQRNAAAQCQRLEASIHQIEGVIRARAEDAVEEKLAEVGGRLETARARSERYRQEALALHALMEELERARKDAQDAYFEPVKREIKPLLRMLHGNAEFEMDGDSMLLSSLVRGGVEDSLDVLSGGAYEQIAILTRLAFAQLYRKSGAHIPVILDDALVHSDDERIGTMFTLLTHVAREQQIIVFSCRGRAFSDLGGHRAAIEVCDLAA